LDLVKFNKILRHIEINFFCSSIIFNKLNIQNIMINIYIYIYKLFSIIE